MYRYAAACDVYSFGLVVCEMLTNKIPFEDIHEFAIINRVVGLALFTLFTYFAVETMYR